MTNFQKRILTALIVLPISLFFIFIGGYPTLLFLLTIFFLANYELFSSFKKRTTILFLNLILILSLYSIYLLSERGEVFLLWIIILVVCSDVGGYVFGKLFKWKKFTNISPNKTVSGVFGSFIFSLMSPIIVNFIIDELTNFKFYLSPKYFFFAIIFSLIAQSGDLTISYFKRQEKIKDTGKILPGHGGIFDRIDGLMFVSIIAYILFDLRIIG
tara:strand:+ start:577 stop:1218 length:642 start_codon:yes stop_codon:yes gene_type:complete